MLKRLCLYIVTAVLTVFTVGLNVSVQYCGGEYMGVRINGVQILSDAGEEMSCCTDDDEGCNACRHIHHHFQLQSQFVVAQGLHLSPPAVYQWGAPLLVLPCHELLLPAAEEGGEARTAYWYGPPGHSQAETAVRGLRAPPVWA